MNKTLVCDVRIHVHCLNTSTVPVRQSLYFTSWHKTGLYKTQSYSLEMLMTNLDSENQSHQSSVDVFFWSFYGELYPHSLC